MSPALEVCELGLQAGVLECEPRGGTGGTHQRGILEQGGVVDERYALELVTARASSMVSPGWPSA